MTYNPSFSRDPRGNFESQINDSFVSIVGGTDALLLEDELNEMQWIQNEARASFTRKIMPTGVVNFLSGLTAPSSQNEFGVGPGSTTNFNQFFVRGFAVNTYGFELDVFSNNSPTNDLNVVILDEPPTQDDSIASLGSARDDLALLEMWFAEVTGSQVLNEYGGVNAPATINNIIDPRVGSETTERVQLQWRIRMIDGVDFTTHPEGLRTIGLPWNTNGVRVTPQGPQLSIIPYNATYPVITQFHQIDPNVDAISKSIHDVGLFIAGDGTQNAMTILNTFNGYVYAIPLFKVRRRNSQPWNVDTNQNGGRGYPGNMIVSQAVAMGATTIYVQNVDPNLQINDVVNLWGNNGKVTSVNTTNNFITVDTPAYATSTNSTLAVVSAISDRPDGLFNNIVDLSDIIDLRHNVSINNNHNAILNKNLELLMRGELGTIASPMHNRVFSGIQPFADDINTVLLVNFDGNNLGVSNGVTITPNSAPGITIPVFTPGVAGSGTYIPTGVAGSEIGILYDLGLFNPSQSPFTIEFFLKPGNWGGVASNNENSRFLFTMFDQGGNEVLSLYRDHYGDTTNHFTAEYIDASGTMAYVFGPSGTTSLINAGEWHYVKFVNDPTSNIATFQVDESTITLSSLPMENTNVASCLIGDKDGNGNFTVDEFRLSNISRAGSPLPLNYAFANGDRIVNGPDNTTYKFADDGITPAGTPDSPLGISYVPLNTYNPAWLNNTELRHYVANGLTPNWTRAANGVGDSVGESMIPDGRMEGSAEYMWVSVNENVDGNTSTFTVNIPPSKDGHILLKDAMFNVVSISNASGSSVAAPTALNINGSIIQFTLGNAPTAGDDVQFLIFTGSSHVHYIPSTRGYEIHGWNNQSLTINYLANPSQTPTLAPVNYTGGTLATGIAYYIRYTFTTPYGETLPSPETTLTLPSGYNAINASISAMPSNATGIKWYFSTSSDTETYNAISTTNTVNLVALSGVSASTLPTTSTAQLTNLTLPLNRDIETGLITVVNNVRIALSGETSYWVVPQTGYALDIAGGPNTAISGWAVTDTLGNPLTLPHDNAGITFNGILPEGATVDAYYEYVYVPQIGDTVKLCVGHPVFQGMINGQAQTYTLHNGQLISNPYLIISTEGSGKVDSLNQVGNVYRLNRSGPAITNLPLANNFNVSGSLKGDSLEGFATILTEFSDLKFMGASQPNNGNAFQNPWYVPGNSVQTICTTPSQPAQSLVQVIGEDDLTTEGCANFIIKNLTSSIPTLGILAMLVRDNGRLRLVVNTTYNTSSLVDTDTAWDGFGITSNANIFELIGRPLIVETF